MFRKAAFFSSLTFLAIAGTVSAGGFGSTNADGNQNPFVMSPYDGGAMAAGGNVTEINPFTGQKAESFEAFQNYLDDPDFNMDNPTTIFGGNTTIGGSDEMVIYEPGAADFSLVGSGFAQVVDGQKGFGLDNDLDTIVIDFLNDDVVDFGGYFGAATFGGPSTITFDFFDGSGNLLDSIGVAYDHEASGDGGLDWHGFHSDVALGHVEITAPFLVMDFLQKNIPTPGALALLGIAGFVSTRRRRR